MTKEDLKKQILGILAVQIKDMEIGLEQEMTPAELKRLDTAKDELMDEFYRRIAAAQP